VAVTLVFVSRAVAASRRLVLSDSLSVPIPWEIPWFFFSGIPGATGPHLGQMRLRIMRRIGSPPPPISSPGLRDALSAPPDFSTCK